MRWLPTMAIWRPQCRMELMSGKPMDQDLLRDSGPVPGGIRVLDTADQTIGDLLQMQLVVLVQPGNRLGVKSRHGLPQGSQIRLCGGRYCSTRVS